MAQLKYRPDIDGLRAVAVISVLVFHLNLGLTGGFVGVDIFFVISGYLIGKLVIDECSGQRFSLLRFYERRARRILPALLVTIVVCTAPAVFLLYPDQLISFSKSAIASILSLGNMYFYNTSGYFVPNAETLPLLHLWSLGVEEQFYIFFPLIVIAYAKRPRRLRIILIVIAIVALLLSHYLAINNPPASFYLLPSRAFELLIGVLVSQTPRVLSKVTANIMAVFGGGLVISSLFLLTPETTFPGFYALAPCLGAALIIRSGEREPTLVSKLLSIRPATFCGRISYSLYLIHWPIIVFGRMAFPDAGTLTFATVVALSAFCLATVSYYVVETPFRKGSLGSRKTLIISAVAMIFASLVPAIFVLSDGFRSRLDNRVNSILAYTHKGYANQFMAGGCFLEPEQDFPQFKLSKCLPHGEKRALLWGDSHAAHLYRGLKDELSKRSISLGILTASLCQPLIGFDIPARPFCKNINDHVKAIIKNQRPDLVILSALWSADDNTMRQLSSTLEYLKSLGIEVVVIGNSPLYKKPVPEIIADRIHSHENPKFARDSDFAAYPSFTSDESMQKFVEGFGVPFISITKLMCDDNRCPLMLDEYTPFYFDSGHLTEPASRAIAKTLATNIISASHGRL